MWHTTEALKRHGLKAEPGIQHVGGFTLYPSEYFCPKDYATNRLHITPKTISIHHYEASWHTFSFRVRRRLRRYALKALGRHGADRLGRIFHSIAGPRKFRNQESGAGERGGHLLEGAAQVAVVEVAEDKADDDSDDTSYEHALVGLFGKQHKEHNQSRNG